MTTQTIKNHRSLEAPTENILVVKRDILLGANAFQGLQQGDCQEVVSVIMQHKEFLPRTHMETDPRYKQIIPYLVFNYQDRYFLMQRQSQASEQRLKNKYTLGIGGHIRAQDLTAGTTIFDWAQREFHEEVHYYGPVAARVIGILNDDSNEVGKVHAGLIVLLEGTHDQIKIKSELKNGQLATLNECSMYRDSMETWSQIVFDSLLKEKS